jgi:hypothetical protein
MAENIVSRPRPREVLWLTGVVGAVVFCFDRLVEVA